MPKFHLEATKSTPEILLDHGSATYIIVGISTPINAFEFYDQVAQWLSSEKDNIAYPATFTFHLPYFNSASMKALLLVFREITNQVQQEKKWKVRWIIEDEDEFMADAAESFEQLLNIEFEIVAIKN